MILETFEKQPREVKDYDVTYSPWLIPIADTIDDVVYLVECLDDPLDTSFIVIDVQLTTDRVKVKVRGGTNGYIYKVTLLISTVGGRVDESELLFVVRDV